MPENIATTAKSGSLDIDAAQQMLMDRMDGDDQPAEREPAPEPDEPDEQQHEEATAEAPEADADDDGDEAQDDEGQDADDDEEGADEQPTEPDESPKLYLVKIDGTEQEVTEDELKAGYQRQADYTRKTMEIADGRKATEAERQQLMGERQQVAQAREAYLARVAEMESAYDAVQEPDWTALLNEARETGDDLAYHEKRNAWDQLVKQRTEIKTAREQAEREQSYAIQAAQMEQKEKYDAYIAEQRVKLLERAPDWNDETKRDAEIAEIAKVAKETYGLSEQEMSKIGDHRHLLLLRDAVKWQQRQKAAKAKVKQATAKKAPQVLAPTSPQQPRNRATEKARNMKRLRATGSVEDAARLLEER